MTIQLVRGSEPRFLCRLFVYSEFCSIKQAYAVL
jgi:hypothetical protein